MVTEGDLRLNNGRALHYYSTLDGPNSRLAVFWQHGTPNTGAPPEPLFAAAERHGIRWVSHDRPGYGGSTPNPGRDVASVAGDVAAVADALGIERFAVMGHSGGGPHALACAALLPDRVLGAVSVSGMAPFGADGLDWFAGIADAGVAELRAAVRGGQALADHLAASEFDPEQFTPADHAALAGEWSWLGDITGQALADGTGGMVDDGVACANPWGFEPESVRAPVLFLHGEQDRMVPSSHGKWLAHRGGRTELWLRPDDGHISVLDAAEAALEWLRAHAD